MNRPFLKNAGGPCPPQTPPDRAGQNPAAACPDQAAPAVISLRGITNSFGAASIHENLDLDIRKGEILGVIGGSGTGKSVLLRTILGLNRQKKGSVTILGADMARLAEKEKDAIRRLWGVLFQDGALFSSLTVSENIQFPLREFTDLPPSLRREIARMKIAAVGLPLSSGGKFPAELSGGMRKRAGLARALAMDPEILLLDEPTAGLDPLAAADFDQLLLTLRKNLDLTVGMVTHDLDALYAVCDRVAVLAEKRIYAVDTIDKLIQLDHPWIREYFTGPRGRAKNRTASP
jgi:phospholipid/cholesterol/gamma-HCH transport system ATP-binding protein